MTVDEKVALASFSRMTNHYSIYIDGEREMTTDEKVVLTPSEVLRRLRKNMPKDAPIPEERGGGFEENGIEGALNQLYSYDKEAVVAWLLDLPIEDLPDDSP